jgi:hypothetical protein
MKQKKSDWFTRSAILLKDISMSVIAADAAAGFFAGLRNSALKTQLRLQITLQVLILKNVRVAERVLGDVP